MKFYFRYCSALRSPSFNVAIRGDVHRLTGRMDATTVLSDPTKGPDPDIATVHWIAAAFTG
jgi:hypothetical protein